MDLERINRILELPGVPAFAAAEGAVLCAVNGAGALGFAPGAALSDALPALGLPAPGEPALEARLSLGGSLWRLRAAAETECTLCFLHREAASSPGPNENTLLRAAGTIRLALQDITVAMDALTAPGAANCDPRSGGLAMRGVYRLRRTAEEMELYARLQSGSYVLACRELSVCSTVSAFLGELNELLRAADRELSWELPPRDFLFCLDWPLLTVLLQGLIANAAANSADGKLRVKLTRSGTEQLLFTVTNRPAEPLPELLFDLHAGPQQDLRSGPGLGLSLIRAGAACHGGSLLLSTDRDGAVTALLRIAAGTQTESANRSFIQLPVGPEADLAALSPILPPEQYRPDALL